MEETIVYFIEQKGTGKWVAPMYKMKSQYTKNPHKATAFKTFAQALRYGLEKDEIITEHIFVEETQTFI